MVARTYTRIYRCCVRCGMFGSCVGAPLASKKDNETALLCGLSSRNKIKGRTRIYTRFMVVILCNSLRRTGGRFRNGTRFLLIPYLFDDFSRFFFCFDFFLVFVSGSGAM